MTPLQQRLDEHVLLRNCPNELSDEKPDPLMMARRFGDECNALPCALFAYGNVQSIIAFLRSLEPLSLEMDEAELMRAAKGKYYRFQTQEDVAQWLVSLKRLKDLGGVEKAFEGGYKKEENLIDGINAIIETLYALNPYRSCGYTFLIGKPIHRISGTSAMKRWMMYMRWMVRCDHLDMGLWKGVRTDQLIIPLDTHTFSVSRKLGLLQRKQCDLKAAIELTEALRCFDPHDPVKYDFALYRLGQEQMIL